jgi:hypothetical protein
MSADRSNRASGRGRAGRCRLLALVALFSLLSLACTIPFLGGEGTPTTPAEPIEPPTTTAEAIQPPTTTAEAIQPPPATSEPTQPPTAAPPPVAGPPQIAGLDSLDSYRRRIVWTTQRADGSTSSESDTLQEWVRGDQPAAHILTVMTDPDDPGATITSELIYVGDTGWARQIDGSWLAREVQGWEENITPFSFDAEDVQEVEWTAAGEETVGGVHCQHYTFREEVPPEGEDALPMPGEIDLWVADQPDLPPVIVRQRLRWVGEESSAPGEILTTELDIQLSDLNAPIVIEAPAPPPTQPPPPTDTQPPPTAAPSATPTPPPQFVEAAPYTGDCKQRPSGSVCLTFDDGYVLLIYDSVAGRAYGNPWQGKPVQIIWGFKADYHHVLGTNLIMVVAK